MPDVSVIIVNWNTKGLLRDCIKSVYQQAGNIAYEVIVVDNASSDGSVEMVRREFPQVRLIAEKINHGYAGGMNRGMEVACGRYFLLLNSDIIICDRAIEKTVQYADKHPEAAIVGCQVRDSNAMVQKTFVRFPSLLNLLLDTVGLSRLFSNNRFFGREWMVWCQRDTEREVDFISGVFMLARRQAVEEVGLMDEAFFFFFEETDWCRRFSKAGWKMLFWPGAKVMHVHGGGQSRKMANFNMLIQYRRSKLIFFRKHYGIVQYFLARLLLTVHSGLRFLMWGVLRLYRGLAGRDTKCEKEKMRLYWRSFWYCMIGIESGGDLMKVIKRSAERVKKGIEIICALVCRTYSLLFREAPARVILSYHSMKRRDIAGFERQMGYLSKFCRVVRPSDVFTVSQDGAKPVVAVIFDDAYNSFKDNALPVLSRYGLTAAVAVPVEAMGAAPNWSMDDDDGDRDEVVLDSKAVIEIDRLGYEILSHTVSHRDLTQISGAELEHELCASKCALEKILGHEVNGITYPYGACNATVREAAAKAGYLFGFSLEPQTVCKSTDHQYIGRFNVSPNECMFGFKLKAKGAYRAAYFLRWLKRKLMGCRSINNKRGL
jgi:hypothetical protein